MKKKLLPAAEVIEAQLCETEGRVRDNEIQINRMTETIKGLRGEVKRLRECAIDQAKGCKAKTLRVGILPAECDEHCRFMVTFPSGSRGSEMRVAKLIVGLMELIAVTQETI